MALKKSNCSNMCKFVQNTGKKNNNKSTAPPRVQITILQLYVVFKVYVIS